MIFDKQIKKKVGICEYRLLLVDGHFSHVNLDFFAYADKNQIIVLVLLFHAIHQLQSLNIRLFFFGAKYIF